MAIPDLEDPLSLFHQWLDEAKGVSTIREPTAMALSTADAEGRPDVRYVLLKSADADGFTFYTNETSTKGAQLAENPNAALAFYWSELGKQVRVRGAVTPVTGEAADAYFASRPKQSQIGAWASKQSQELTGRFELEGRVAKYAAKYALSAVPRPEFWHGYCIHPTRIEFWWEQPFRLHDRVEYARAATGDPWQRRRLFP